MSWRASRITPKLVAAAVDIAWTEWCAALSADDHIRWLQEAERDCRLNSAFSAGFVAIDGRTAVGTVQLHEFDIDAMRDRSPWVCGMVIRRQYRGMNVGRQLLQTLETFAGARHVERLWVFTEHSSKFYEACGWERYDVAVQGAEPGVVLTKTLST